jgi:hypothetical protein
MSDSDSPQTASIELGLSGWAKGRAWYPRDHAELERLLAALPPSELALIRLPPSTETFSTRIDPQQIVQPGFECSLCKAHCARGPTGYQDLSVVRVHAVSHPSRAFPSGRPGISGVCGPRGCLFWNMKLMRIA